MSKELINHNWTQLTEVITKQQETLEKIQNDLITLQATKVSRLEDSLYSPRLYEHYYKVAVMLSKSGCIPKNYIGKPNDIFVAMSMGYSLGFPVEQSLQDIAVINGRPTLWGDGLLALVISHPECEYINEEVIYKDGKEYGYKCTAKRKGHKEHVKTFTFDDARAARLLSKQGPWGGGYPIRMCQMRARSYAARDKFADALRGLRIAEIELEDEKIINSQVEPINAEGLSQTEKLKLALDKITGGKKSEADNEDDIQSEAKDNQEDVERGVDEGAVGDSDEGEGSSNEQTETPELITESQIEVINEMLIELKFTDDRVMGMMDHYGISTLSEMTYYDAESCINGMLKQKKGK